MNSKHLLQRIEKYCRDADISEATLGVRVLNNSRFVDRLRKRVERDAEAEQKLFNFMAQNPAESDTERGAA